ncbi:hypothetical protein Mapa_008683 [Marchantia paleacea]|nr:hypothetical protein Mapa_008683 [Marchantia paleacea]
MLLRRMSREDNILHEILPYVQQSLSRETYNTQTSKTARCFGSNYSARLEYLRVTERLTSNFLHVVSARKCGCRGKERCLFSYHQSKKKKKRIWERSKLATSTLLVAP